MVKKIRKFNWDMLFKLTRDISKDLDKTVKKNPVNEKVRELVKIRDKNRCGVCNVEGIYGIGDDGKIDLHLHHIIPNGPSDINNLIYLCKHCHKLIHIILFLEGKWKYTLVSSYASYG